MNLEKNKYKKIKIRIKNKLNKIKLKYRTLFYKIKKKLIQKSLFFSYGIIKTSNRANDEKFDSR